MNKWLKISALVVLSALIVYLAWVLYRQISAPVEYKKELGVRESAVIDRIKDIRAAEQAFRQKHNRYTGDFDSLINFALTETLEFERQHGSKDDSVAVAKGLVKTEKFTKAVRDTVFYPKRMTDDQIKKLRFIPYSSPAKEFTLRAGMLTTDSKVVVPVFEAKAPYKDFMGDLDHQMLVNLIDEAKKVYYKYPGIAVGSIEKATNDAGNWE